MCAESRTDNPIRNTEPTSCEKIMTVYTFVRLVATPPLKSAAPQLAADTNPNKIAASSEFIDKSLLQETFLVLPCRFYDHFDRGRVALR